MTVNVERMLIEMEQSNLVPLNIAGIPFPMLTLTEYHREEMADLESIDEIIEFASHIGLAVKGERAANRAGMSKEKLELFWKSDKFAVEGEESLQVQFGKRVLEESGMDDLLVEPEEEVDPESMLDELEFDDEIEVGPDGRAIVSAA